jgi:hypothetical protein
VIKFHTVTEIGKKITGKNVFETKSKSGLSPHNFNFYTNYLTTPGIQL